MTTESKDEVPPRAGWTKARPEIIPRPTYFPAAMAFGITFLFWGIVTSPVVLAAGVVVLVVALSGWIGEVRHEQRG
jgi:hypothetical protein